MRRSTFAALIIGGGTLLALPFRREPAVGPDRDHGVADQLIDETSLEMLVREVTQDVQAPVVFQPQTDYLNREPASRPERPLTYEDLAVPLDDDPLYAERFNAAADVANRSKQSPKTRRIAELERAFATARFEQPSQPGSATGDREPARVVVDSPNQNGSPSHSVTTSITPPASRVLGGRSQATLARSRDRSSSSAPRQPGLDPRSEQWTQSPAGESVVIAEPPGRSGVGRGEPTGDAQHSARETQHSVLETLPADELSVNPADGERERHWIRQPD